MKARRYIQKEGYKEIVMFRGKNNFSEDSQAVLNILTHSLRVNLGELWYAKNIGLPYQNKQKKTVVDYYAKKMINSIYGVKEIIEFDSIVKEREYKLTVRILTIFGDEMEVQV